MFAELTEVDQWGNALRVINVNPKQVVAIQSSPMIGDLESQQAMLITEVTTAAGKRLVQGSRSQVLAKLEGRAA